MTVERLTYVLRFHRPPTAAGALENPTTATGLALKTCLQASGVSSDFKPLHGATATLELQFALNDDKTQFFEWGGVAFGDDAASRLTFSGVGAGTIGPADTDGFSHGTMMYVVRSGQGRLEGATGRITSNFLIDFDTNELIDMQLGIIRLA